ncbi:MAG: exodeoxyribonuclease VII small subunit [Minisyncoccia bacterium]
MASGNLQEKFNFSKAYKEIEEINEWFQKEDIDLDQALENYERAMELIKKCRERLKQAENKFEEIKKKYEIEE